MKKSNQAIVPPGWVGGFAESNPKFAYGPDSYPDLSSLPMLDNMANINLLERQQGVEWPEFSWITQPGGDESTRCFRMFAPYISRLGYTNTGRVYSIICPQQGIYIKGIGYLNVEVTVTGQRGWVNETTREVAADMTVEAKVWFGPSAHKSSFGEKLLEFFTYFNYPFPSKKKNAVIITTHAPGNPDNPIFPVRKGETKLFQSPSFARHPKAWTVANVEVEIGPVQKRGISIVDEFNNLVVELFNLVSGNLLLSGNLLSWNVWFKAPRLVDQEEWRDHAEKWRKSIDEDHGSPDGEGTNARYFDGSPFKPFENLIDEKVKEIIEWIKEHI